MAAETDDATLAVVVARLDDLRADFHREITGLRATLESQRTDMVARSEWVQRNHFVDREFSAKGKEIADIRTEIAGRRAPWWSLASAIAAVTAVVVTIIQSIN